MKNAQKFMYRLTIYHSNNRIIQSVSFTISLDELDTIVSKYLLRYSHCDEYVIDYLDRNNGWAFFYGARIRNVKIRTLAPKTTN